MVLAVERDESPLIWQAMVKRPAGRAPRRLFAARAAWRRARDRTRLSTEGIVTGTALHCPAVATMNKRMAAEDKNTRLKSNTTIAIIRPQTGAISLVPVARQKS